MCVFKTLPDWAQQNVVRHIFLTAAELGGEARIVGGAVRDWQAGRVIGDIDMAVNLPIQLMADKLRQNQRMMVVESGVDHGTITVMEDLQQIELTQTRSDVVTNGRQALVQFQDDWTQDATRRDFTINALYLDANGQIFDPLGGLDDLAKKRLRFVGKAADRVQEDALRMLRYCRLFIDFSDKKCNPEALMALQKFAPTSANLSGERVTQELSKMMSNENCRDAVCLLNETGLDKFALGVKMDVENLPTKPEEIRLVINDFSWLVLFLAVIPKSDLSRTLKRMRLRRADHKFCLRVASNSKLEVFKDLIGPQWQQSAFFMQGYAAATYACMAWRLGHIFNPDHYQRIHQWQPPQFPLSGADLLSHGVDNGPVVGHLLRKAKKYWVDSNFLITKSALLDQILKRYM